MTKSFKDFSLEGTDFSCFADRPDLAIVNEHFGMTWNMGKYRERFIAERQPYRFVEGRIILILEGEAECELSLDHYNIHKGNVLLLEPDTIVELKSCSDDYSGIGIICNDIDSISENIILSPDPKDWDEIMALVDSLWDIARRVPFRRETVRHLLSCIISDILDIDRAKSERRPVKKEKRREQIFSRFKKLVNENCDRHRSIPFYADKLALTPHYLSSLISNVSGQSVMYWINRAAILQAKVLLKDKEMLVYEVAERLNFPSQSAFGLFFKRETGMTPGQYRNAN